MQIFIVALLLGLQGALIELGEAASFNVEMAGIISGKEAAFLNATSVQAGDSFGLSFQYDDSQQTSQIVSVNGGELYTAD